MGRHKGGRWWRLLLLLFLPLSLSSSSSAPPCPPKKNNGSLCIPGYPRASSVDQAGLKFKRAACLCFLSAVTKVCGTTTHYCWLK